MANMDFKATHHAYGSEEEATGSFDVMDGLDVPLHFQVADHSFSVTLHLSIRQARWLAYELLMFANEKEMDEAEADSGKGEGAGAE